MGLAHPVRARLEERYGNERCKVAVSSMCGFRLTMEDAHTVTLNMQRHPNAAFIGVYDGHGGQQAARYCASHLMNRIDSLDDWSDDALKVAVMQFDAEFLSPDNPQREHGCTCVFAIIEFGADNTVITICNCGDSRAIWSLRTPENEYSLDPLTDDHKPSLEMESARIIRAGGHVQADRVDGDLALSRAIGDWKYKCNPELAMEEQKVIALPDIKRRVITSDLAHGYLLVACDGIFERMSNMEVHAQVYQGLQQSGDPLETVNRLLQASLDAGSKDNMSAALVVFENGVSYHCDSPSIYFGPIFTDNNTFMSAFHKFCEDAGFGPQALEYVERWHEEHGTSEPGSSEAVGSPPLAQALLERLVAGVKPVLVQEGNRTRLVIPVDEDGDASIIEFDGLASDDEDDEQMEEVVASI